MSLWHVSQFSHSEWVLEMWLTSHSNLTCLIHTWHTSWHVSLTCVTMWLTSHSNVTCLNQMWHASLSHVTCQRDSHNVTCLSFRCDTPHSNVTWLMQMWHDSFRCDMAHSDMTWLIQMWHVSHSHVTCLIQTWHDSFTCDMPHSHVQHGARGGTIRAHVMRKYVTWLIHLRDMIHSYVTPMSLWEFVLSVR